MTDTAYIAMGSNLGDRAANLCAGVKALSQIDAVAVLACSAFYDTAPMGPPQPRYLNAVVSIACDLSPTRLLTILKEIERDAGRAQREKWGPRVLDLDIVLWGDRIVAEPGIQIPHLGMHERRFVLEPLAELAPQARHPVLGQTVTELLRKLPPSDVVIHFESGPARLRGED